MPDIMVGIANKYANEFGNEYANKFRVGVVPDFGPQTP